MILTDLRCVVCGHEWRGFYDTPTPCRCPKCGGNTGIQVKPKGKP